MSAEIGELGLNMLALIDPAIVIALAALVLAVWEGISNRRHQRLSVRPSIDLERLTENGGSISLVNTGLGPAIIESVDLLVDGERSGTAHVVEDVEAWGERLRIEEGGGVLGCFAISRGASILPGVKIPLIENHLPNMRDEDTGKTYAAIDRAGVLVSFSSFYGERFVAKGGRVLS